MQITHLGHSCLLLEVAGTRILLDPGTLAGPFEGLTGLDAVVVTHAHPDHLDQARVPALLENSPDAVVLADPDGAEVLTGLGLRSRTLVEREVVLVGGVTVIGHGRQHAANHDGVPRVANRGVVVTADGEPVLFHPGDAYDADPGAVDVLAVPVQAPWTALRDTLDFVRRLRPAAVVPIHDRLLSAAGRGLYLDQLARFGAPDGAPADDAPQVHDLAGRGAARFG